MHPQPMHAEFNKSIRLWTWIALASTFLVTCERKACGYELIAGKTPDQLSAGGLDNRCQPLRAAGDHQDVQSTACATTLVS